MITEAFQGWSDGLATAFVRLSKRLRRARRFRLDATTWPFSLHPLNGKGRTAVQPLAIPESTSTEQLAQLRQRTHGSVLEVAIPAAALLERELGALPAESEPYLESLVRHQLEIIFPWSAGDIFHATLVERQGDGKIGVRVRATSRSAIAPILSAAAACEAGEVVLTGSLGASAADVTTIRIPIGHNAEKGFERARAFARYAIVALLVIGVGVIAWTSFVRWSAANELALLERAIIDRRALLIRASAARAGGVDALADKRRGGPWAVEMLERLSEALPDDTHLTELSLEGNRVRISGISAQAAELVPLLEKSGHFRNAAFYAPTMRIPGTATDRFSIEAMLVDQAEAQP